MSRFHRRKYRSGRKVTVTLAGKEIEMTILSYVGNDSAVALLDERGNRLVMPITRVKLAGGDDR